MRYIRMMLVLTVLVMLAAAPALAQVDGTATTRLRGFEEVPAVAVPNGGTFTGIISGNGSQIDYTLTYTVPEGNVTQAHFHLGQRSVNGGIVVFLCSNLGNGPAGTQACPAKGGTITGTITAANVLAVAGQSSNPMDLDGVLRGIRAGVVYVNVHTDQLPGGSIRGQLLFTPED
jgi:hypothetical protein